MKKRYTFLLLTGALLASPQLGPKDGRELPPADLNRVQVGHPAPDFTLQAADGHPVSLSDYRGKHRVVLVFYRGQW
jgi:cytochrome oxidase Cu insertion factor (SCO1/SenC/PrrC family)